MAEGSRKSGTQILQELEALSETMFQAHTTTRRTASLALPRTAVPPLIEPDEISHVDKADQISLNLNPKPRSRRMSLSPWRSRPKPDGDVDDKKTIKAPTIKTSSKWSDEAALTSSSVAEKKGIWKWKPIRALSHITMQKLSCLFSIEVVTVQNLPASMNGLRLAVCVRKKESKDGLVQTMPSRVSQMAADFEETLFVRCHVYFSPAGGGAQMRFEPRPFLIYVVAVDAEELDFGRSTVDLSGLIQESVEKSLEGSRIRQWDTSLKLLGKAKGGELVLKLGFQIMEKDGGVGIYSQAEGQRSKKSPSVARKQSKSSFSVPSPRMRTRTPPSSQNVDGDDDHLQGMDDLNLDEPGPDQVPEKKAQEAKIEDIDLPDFDVVDKGVEIQEEQQYSEVKRSVSSEVVKEVVQDESHVMRMSELDSIAQQIKELESMMGKLAQKDEEEEETGSQALDADEDKVTREFLQMLEVDDDNDVKAKIINSPSWRVVEKQKQQDDDGKEETFLADLGKGLGCIVQTRDGGYLAAMNPMETIVDRKERPKLAMQVSKPVVMESEKTGVELLQKLGAMGADKMASEMAALMPMDDLIGKTAEQIAFEGIASAIIHGRNKEGATSSAARTIAALKSMVSALNNGRKERVSTGIWNVSDEPLTPHQILPFSMQKMESMALEALKVQAEISEDQEAPFHISPLVDDDDGEKTVLASAIPIEDWIKVKEKTITMAVLVQLRDPIRQYEGVGGPMVGFIHATLVDEELYGEEKRYKVGSVQVGGVKGSKHVWDTEKQRLTALQWLVGNGMGKGAGKKPKRAVSKGPNVLWSLSSRIMADMWLKPLSNKQHGFWQCSWTLMSIRMNHPFRAGKSLPARQEAGKLQILYQ